MKTPTAVVHDPAKRDAILDAAIRTFAADGFRNADVQVIADAAGVGKGTVYRYFGNKEELFRAVAETGMTRLESHITESLAGIDCPRQLVFRAGIAYAEFFQQRPQLVEILIQERAEFRGSIPDTHLFYRQKNRGKFEQILRRGIETGVFRSANVREATNAFANMLYGTVVCGVLEGNTRGIGRTTEHAIEIFLRGILVEPDSVREAKTL